MVAPDFWWQQLRTWSLCASNTRQPPPEFTVRRSFGQIKQHIPRTTLSAYRPWCCCWRLPMDVDEIKHSFVRRTVWVRFSRYIASLSDNRLPSFPSVRSWQSLGYHVGFIANLSCDPKSCVSDFPFLFQSYDSTRPDRKPVLVPTSD